MKKSTLFFIMVVLVMVGGALAYMVSNSEENLTAHLPDSVYDELVGSVVEFADELNLPRSETERLKGVLRKAKSCEVLGNCSSLLESFSYDGLRSVPYVTEVPDKNGQVDLIVSAVVSCYQGRCLYNLHLIVYRFYQSGVTIRIDEFGNVSSNGLDVEADYHQRWEEIKDVRDPALRIRNAALAAAIH